MFKTILVPTDGSDISQQAVAAAIDYARCCGAAIVALSVAEPYPVVPVVDGALVIDPGLDSRELQAQARERVDRIAAAAAAAGVPCTTLVALSFHPHEEIIAAAAQHHCDVIFMASHGRRGLGRLLAGSETQKVLAYAQAPVLVFRPPLAERI
ncbi:universal stress protein [Massilia sp. RP-1-19]|uniref:Universal stress protein n=1 Tax=Massilia polaris TaxID=2728846 RepID=A0A848HIR2_9BURK|nr:universal stress protein [Massilia polaris]NML60962.1 universal stress protein [Massilia polaris]